MNKYVTGAVIRKLRENKKLTQEELAACEAIPRGRSRFTFYKKANQIFSGVLQPSWVV